MHRMLVLSAVLAAGILALSHAIVRADTCAPEAVTARGENSRFTWSAKTKARANWRRKVRSIPGLGPDYANWSRARDTDEHCIAGPVGSVCVFSGVPCKS